MKKILSHYIPIALMALLVNGIADWSPLLSDSKSSLVSIAEASGKDKDKDKDKDTDYTKADCKDDTGICANQGTVSVIGMTGKIDVRSGSGSVLLEVNSSDVELQSMSGDLTANGLTGKAKFKTEIGNAHAKYCESTVSIGNKELKIEIKDSPDGVDEDGDDNNANAHAEFPAGSEIKIEIAHDADKYKTDFTHDSNADFKFTGEVNLGFLVISSYTLPTPPCNY